MAVSSCRRSRAARREGIQDLPATMPSRAGGLRQNARRRRPGAPPAEPGAVRISAEGLRLEGVPRQDGHGLAVDLVVGGLAPAQIVVVHAGQVVVDQGVGVDHLQCAGRRAGPPASRRPASRAELQRQHRPDPLAAGQQAVAHGLVQVAPVRLSGGKQPLPGTPPPPAGTSHTAV